MLDAVIERPRFEPLGLWSIVEIMPSITTKTFTRESPETDPRDLSGVLLQFKEGKELLLPLWKGEESEGLGRPIVDLSKGRFVITGGSKFESHFRDDPDNQFTEDTEKLVRTEKNLIPFKPEKYQKLYTFG